MNIFSCLTECICAPRQNVFVLSAEMYFAFEGSQWDGRMPAIQSECFHDSDYNDIAIFHDNDNNDIAILKTRCVNIVCGSAVKQLLLGSMTRIVCENN